jgi:hypothetical protein
LGSEYLNIDVRHGIATSPLQAPFHERSSSWTARQREVIQDPLKNGL